MKMEIAEIEKKKLRGMYDAGVASLQHRDRQRIGPDGFPVFNERHGTPKEVRGRRPCPTQKWVSWNGQIVNVRLSNGSGSGVDVNRREAVKERMHRAMAIRYGTCPLRDELSINWIPSSMRGQEPCAPKSASEAQCCPHVEEVIKVRRDRHEQQRTRMLKRSRKDQMERLADLLDDRKRKGK